ncbi:MAG: hypothetical protein ICV60_16270 [Pyrinomonadaceae bacterium]|nr:hypothetical protein [Pyrinomonadaceae bacterium]
MKTVRLLSGGLKIISLLTFGLCLLSGWLFYEFYLKWLPVFEDGRYFDSETGVVYHDTGSVWGILSLSLLLISIVLWLLASKIKGARRGS